MFLSFLTGGKAFAQYDKDVFFGRGRMALADGKYATAIENFNVLSRLDTTDYWTFFFRGIAKYNPTNPGRRSIAFWKSARASSYFPNRLRVIAL